MKRCTLNNNQSVSLIPKTAHRDYKLLNPGSQKKQINPRITISNCKKCYITTWPLRYIQYFQGHLEGGMCRRRQMVLHHCSGSGTYLANSRWDIAPT